MARCDLNLGKTWRGEDVGEIVRRWISEVSKRYRLKMVIAIGSRVEGRAKPWSDVDLVVVVEN
ncbi:MAG: nucleotidyltransferase family protein, partial [Candidatus Baldrarchaeia archaeon]